MVNNKRAKQTLALVAEWEKEKPVNKRNNNKVIVEIDADGWRWVWPKPGSQGELYFISNDSTIY